MQMKKGKKMKCQICKVTGPNMRRCKKCGQIYCLNCALKGNGPYPKITVRNICPFCGKHDCSETAR